MAASDLTSLAFLTTHLSAAGITLTTAEIAALPALITSASSAVVRACNDRPFVRQTFTEVYRPGYDGRVGLRQFPVNGVSRVSSGRTGALQVINTDSITNQRASIAFTSTGDVTAGLAFTGVALSRTASGVTTWSPLTFAIYPTVTSLAAAINAVGSGWAATILGALDGWPTSDLYGGDVAQGALGPGPGCTLNAFANDLQGCQLDRRLGLLNVGIGWSGSADGPRWGPYSTDPEGRTPTLILVAYDAGFDVVPYEVQVATVLTAKYALDTYGRDLATKQEAAGRGSYTLRDDLLFAIPPEAMGLISRYVIHRL